MSSLEKFWKSLNIQNKIIVPILFVSIIVGTATFVVGHIIYEDAGTRALIDKARTMVLVAESAREFTADQMKRNVFQPQLTSAEDVLRMVPIFAAMDVVRKRASELGYNIKTPKFSPRNPDNQPDEFEAEALHELERNTAQPEYWRIDEKSNTIRYFRAITLTQECMKCHGDPAQSMVLWGRADGRDITGAKMENWKVGEVHGAFEILMKLDALQEDVRSKSSFLGLMVTVALLVIILTTVSISKMISRNINQVKDAALEVAAGNTNVYIDIPQTDEVGILSKSFNTMVKNIRQALEIVEQKSEMANRAAAEATSARNEVLKINEDLQRLNDNLISTNQDLDAANEKISQHALSLQQQNELIMRYNEQLDSSNISLRKQNETIEKQNNLLNDLIKEKNVFLGVVAHDLKNPIASIMLSSEMLLTKVVALSQEKVDKILNRIYSTSHRMQCTVEELLEINSMMFGGETQFDKYNPTELLSELFDQINAQGKAKDIQIHFFAEHNIYILADRNKFLRVMENILSNAIKFSPLGKQIWIRLYRNNTFIRCEVQDQGQGMSLDDMEKLFGRFTRLSAQPTAGEHSTGLGLYIVKQMVDSMNGKVWAESPGKDMGTTFIVELLEANELSEANKLLVSNELMIESA